MEGSLVNLNPARARARACVLCCASRSLVPRLTSAASNLPREHLSLTPSLPSSLPPSLSLSLLPLVCICMCICGCAGVWCGCGGGCGGVGVGVYECACVRACAFCRARAPACALVCVSCGAYLFPSSPDSLQQRRVQLPHVCPCSSGLPRPPQMSRTHTPTASHSSASGLLPPPLTQARLAPRARTPRLA
jgi:hypothetical protein